MFAFAMTMEVSGERIEITGGGLRSPVRAKCMRSLGFSGRLRLDFPGLWIYSLDLKPAQMVAAINPVVHKHRPIKNVMALYSVT